MFHKHTEIIANHIWGEICQNSLLSLQSVIQWVSSSFKATVRYVQSSPVQSSHPADINNVEAGGLGWANALLNIRERRKRRRSCSAGQETLAQQPIGPGQVASIPALLPAACRRVWSVSSWWTDGQIADRPTSRYQASPHPCWWVISSLVLSSGERGEREEREDLQIKR